MPDRSPLEDPEKAAFAWGRYKRLMRLMAGVSLLATILILGWFYSQYGFVSIHFYVALALGIVATIMLAGALMGLAFLSAGTGHDEVIDDPIADRINRKR